jgi:hypothetical protein
MVPTSRDFFGTEQFSTLRRTRLQIQVVWLVNPKCPQAATGLRVSAIGQSAFLPGALKPGVRHDRKAVQNRSGI